MQLIMTFLKFYTRRTPANATKLRKAIKAVMPAVARKVRKVAV